MEIIYYAYTGNMGDTPEDWADAYRKWAKSQIEQEYPDAEVDVLNEDSVNQVYVNAESYQEEDEITDFVSRLWDNCSWSGEYFDDLESEQ